MNDDDQEIKIQLCDTICCDVLPGEKYRDWFSPYTYRCLPLSIANEAGWDISSPIDIVAFRKENVNNKNLSEELKLKYDENDCVDVIEGKDIAESHFGLGTITIKVGYVWNTPPGTQLLIMPVPNQMTNWMPMTTMIETDVLKYPWFLTIKLPLGLTRIPAKTPLCRIIPINMSLINKSKISFINMTADSETEIKKIKDKREELEKNKEPTKPSWTRVYHDAAKYRTLKKEKVEDFSVDVPELLKKLEIYTIPGFLTQEECEEVISLWDMNYNDGINENSIDNFWKGRSQKIECRDYLMKKFQSDIKDIIEEKTGEKPQYRRDLLPHLIVWPKGHQGMTPHRDTDPNMRYPGRKWAALIYLTDAFDGGELYFPDHDLELKCERGSLVIMNGANLLHGVRPVENADRWTLSMWFGPTIPYWMKTE